MSNPANNQRMPRQDAADVCGALLVLLVFLAPAVLVATYLDDASRLVADWVQALIHSATQGAWLC